jgi:hypothetical protein
LVTLGGFPFRADLQVMSAILAILLKPIAREMFISKHLPWPSSRATAFTAKPLNLCVF